MADLISFSLNHFSVFLFVFVFQELLGESVC